MEPIFINEASLAALAGNTSSSSNTVASSPNLPTPPSTSPSLLTASSSSSSSSFTTSGSVSQVNVHPVVLFSILDQYIRRESPGDKVIGALLGTVNNGVIEVTNSFGIYHKATQDEILIRRQTLYDMLELYKRIEPKEVLVGWYSTWKEQRGASSIEERLNSNSNQGGASEHIDQFSLVVQDFFAEATGGKFTPFHMLVDVSLTSPHIKIFAYKPIMNHIIKNVIIQFARLKVQVIASTEERVALDTMVRSGRLTANVASVGGHGPVPVTGEAKDVAPELDSLVSSLQRLLRLLDTVSTYVDDVVSGKRESDEALGRQIADALSSIPSLSIDRFRGTLDTTIKDTLMVTYLSQLATVHLKIAERISQLPAF